MPMVEYKVPEPLRSMLVSTVDELTALKSDADAIIAGLNNVLETGSSRQLIGIVGQLGRLSPRFSAIGKVAQRLSKAVHMS